MPCGDCRVLLDENVAAQKLWQGRVAKLEAALREEREKVAMLTQQLLGTRETDVIARTESKVMSDAGERSTSSLVGAVVYPERPLLAQATVELETERPSVVAAPLVRRKIEVPRDPIVPVITPQRPKPAGMDGYVDVHTPRRAAELHSPQTDTYGRDEFAADWVQSQSVSKSALRRPAPQLSPPRENPAQETRHRSPPRPIVRPFRALTSPSD
jgi:hypothetical protein